MHKIAEKSWSGKIFKAYDIRGVYPAEINEDAVYRTARAFARYLKLSNPTRRGLGESGKDGKILKIVVSADARTSSPALKEAFLDGLLDENVEIIDAGLTTTPMHYFTVNKAEADGGAMITASHISPPANGIKLTKRGASPIYWGGGMEEIKNDAIRGIFVSPIQEEQPGAIRKVDFLDQYIQFLADKFSALVTFHSSLVVCAGNGMTAILLKKLFNNFPNFNVTYLHNDLDMTFPNHEADPLKTENLKDIIDFVLKKGVDLGISFDGDGDRVGFVAENGARIGGDIITALLARYFVSEGESVIYDLRASRSVKEEIERLGGRPLESRVGHAFIKALMRKENAVFGGELSGHYYFRDFFFAESGVFAVLALLDLMRKESKSLSELASQIMKYCKSEEINFPYDPNIFTADKILDQIVAKFSDGEVSYVDGIKIEYEDWWFNLRPAANENFIRLNLEAATPEILEEKKKLIFELLKAK